MRINQNALAINAYRNLSATNVSLGKSLEKLSSGFRINRAADDAAGLVISQNLRAQISGLRQATRNAQDGISVVQTAEGALTEVHTMLERMRTLAVQAANTGANNANARDAIQGEITELNAEITRIAESTSFGGVKLLDGTYGVQAATNATAAAGVTQATWQADGSASDFTITVAGGAEVTVDGVDASAAASADDAAKLLEDAINTALEDAGVVHAGNVSVTASEGTTAGNAVFTLSVAGLADGETYALDNTGGGLTQFGLATAVTAASGQGGVFQIGADADSATNTLNISIQSLTAESLGIDSIDVTTDAAAAITALDSAISTVSEVRGTLGASQNRFESVINNLNVTVENLVASESRIRDTDMASEMTSFTRNQILSQAGTAMLAQANQVPQTVLSLLR